ncbi:hypothetical protein VTN77DRAFT_6240 [Rasamsonia byssochlamydoides]|uniref:uncharacterized protein n=1 Tax=Rasamsonia byssochlamydoides TaxID=89139 RepID=UPI0037437155
MFNLDPFGSPMSYTRQIIPRRKHTKSRTGCRTCKVRRVRCDETWPVCRRCSSTGRLCEGPSPASSKNDGDGPDTKRGFEKVVFTQPLTLSAFRPPIIKYDTEQERHYIGLFCTKLIPKVSGYTPYPIWGSLLLQAIQEEKAVYQAALAVTALVASRQDLGAGAASSHSKHPEKMLALSQYGKCLSSLQAVAKSQDNCAQTVVLLGSLLCIWFEVMLEDHTLALLHLEHCLKILESQQGNVDPDLESTFIRLDLHASLYMGRRPPALKNLGSSEIPQTFQNLDEAETKLYQVLNRVYRFQTSRSDDYRYREVGSVPLELLLEAQSLEKTLHQWHTACITLSLEIMDEDWQPRRLALLQINYYIAVIAMATCLYVEECIYDRFKEQFGTIVSLAWTLLSTAKDDIPKQRDRETFSMEMGVIYPLYFTAIKCRDPTIRQKAIEMLEFAPLTEGVWYGCIMVAIARRVRFLEEEGDTRMGGDIPEFRRVHSADLDIDHRRRQVHVCFRRRLNGLDGEWDDLIEVIRW